MTDDMQCACGSCIITLIVVVRPRFFLSLVNGFRFKRFGLTRKPMGIQVTRVALHQVAGAKAYI